MSTGLVVLFVVVGAIAVVLLMRRTKSQTVGGIFKRDRHGRITLVLTPAIKKRKRK